MRGNAAYGAGKGTIWLDAVECIGTESEIGICGHHNWGNHDCTHKENVGDYCSKYIVHKFDDVPYCKNTSCDVPVKL